METIVAVSILVGRYNSDGSGIEGAEKIARGFGSVVDRIRITYVFSCEIYVGVLVIVRVRIPTVRSSVVVRPVRS